MHQAAILKDPRALDILIQAGANLNTPVLDHRTNPPIKKTVYEIASKEGRAYLDAHKQKKLLNKALNKVKSQEDAVHCPTLRI